PMAAMTTSAQAGDRHVRGHHGNSVVIHQHNGFHHKRRVHRHRQHKQVDGSTGLGVALGILGTVVVLDALNKSQTRPAVRHAPTYAAPPRQRYVAPQAFPPAPAAPSVVQYSSLEPWTPGWYRWCDNRYRSFNAETGTFRGYDGRDHFCVPK
ncbi:MAG: BA14K family protein, partial [Pseudomonadota bacterium]